MKRLLLFVFILSGCSQVPTLPPTPASQLEAWRLNARIAISTEHDSWTATVYWQQKGAKYKLRLNSPMGQGAILLEGNANEVVMQTADKKTFKAKNPDTLIADVLNLALPVSNLQYWIRGFPSPNSAPKGYTLNDAKRLYQLRQDDWEIDYKHYININGTFLPKKMFLENNQFKIKIVISSWEIFKK
ncbi:MAG: outer membrane lipoprotein LolB, partial [Thiotrichaceae bacterium]|nr:outer membrane lipoprotein LolB [Thiotrichaceae bacterium]